MDFTFAVIKPDAYAYRKKILMYVRRDFTVLGAKDIVFTPELVRAFYSDHVDKDYFPGLLAHMCSGRSLALKLRSGLPCGSVLDWRQVMGPTNPAVAKQDGDSLRARYGTDLPRNAFHGSDSWESAICEAAVFGMF